MRQSPVIFLLLMLTFSSLCFSQKATEDQNFWFAYTGQYKVAPKWGAQVEIQFRADDELHYVVQNLIRLGALYYPSKKTQLALGYAHVNTFSPKFDEYAGENRIWQQFQHTYDWAEKKNHMVNRFRMEERFVDVLGEVDGNVKVIGTNYGTRFRYLNRNLFHLYGFNENRDEVYAIVQDEFFMNLPGNEVNKYFFDQNRFSAGLGIYHNKMIRFELCYTNQYINPPKGNDVMNHIVLFGILHNLSFYKE